MKTKTIEISVRLFAVSVALHLLTVVGLVTMLVFPGIFPELASRVVTVIEVRVTATPLPATETPIIPTPTAAPPTLTPLPTATRMPLLTTIPCQQGGTAGVDCPLDVDGLAVTVTSLEKASVYTVTTETGEAIPYTPKDEVNDEFLTVHLSFPLGTVKDDLNVWFEDGGMHAPRLVDETGKVYDYAFALVEDETEGLKVAIVFVIARDAKGRLTLVIQGKAQVDLSLVPDTTVEVEMPTPAPTATSIFNP